jgi:hypothetical protein
VPAHLTEGAGLREVAKRLHMSVKTINTHLHNLRGKLGVHSTLEAVALACRGRGFQMPVIQALGKREPALELNALLSPREMLTAPRFLTHRPSGHARFSRLIRHVRA